ncbi:MAG: universal stress protein [Burkholderiaceae bacterium]
MTKVYACIDGAGQTEAVCDYGIWAARRLGVTLEFLHVLDREPEKAAVSDFSGNLELDAQKQLLSKLADLDEQRSKLAQEHGRQILDAARRRATDAGLHSVETRQRHGSLVEAALDVQPEARLYVLGQHPPAGNQAKWYLDLSGEKVVRTLQRPVLITTAAFHTPGRFMIAFDGSATGRKMVQTVAGSPLLKGMECHIVMVADDTPKHQHDLGWARDVMAEAGFSVTTQLCQGNADGVLRDYVGANGMDLLVMGAYGHSRIRELIVGSTTTTLLRASPVPVLVMR